MSVITDAGTGPESTALNVTTAESTCAAMDFPQIVFNSSLTKIIVSWRLPLHTHGVITMYVPGKANTTIHFICQSITTIIAVMNDD